MNFQNKTEFLNSLVNKEDEVKKALTKLYQGVRATNKFLGLENSPELQDTYYKLRIEEVGELFTAIENEDKVEFLDAVVDGLVVVGYEFSLKSEPCPENSFEFLGMQISKNIDQLKYDYEEKDEDASTLGWLEEVFNQLDINHMKAVNEVLESNWSKFPTKSELKETNKEYWDEWESDISSSNVIGFQIEEIEQQGRYIDVYHEVRYDESVGEDRIIFWAKCEKQKDGTIKEFKSPKYVKPRTFKEPDFASCWLN